MASTCACVISCGRLHHACLSYICFSWPRAHTHAHIVTHTPYTLHLSRPTHRAGTIFAPFENFNVFVLMVEKMVQGDIFLWFAIALPLTFAFTTATNAVSYNAVPTSVRASRALKHEHPLSSASCRSLSLSLSSAQHSIVSMYCTPPPPHGHTSPRLRSHADPHSRATHKNMLCKCAMLGGARRRTRKTS